MEAGLATIPDKVTSAHYWGTVFGGGDLDILGHAGGHVRPDPNPVRHGPRRSVAPLFAKVHPRSKTPVNNTIIVAVVVGISPASSCWPILAIGPCPSCVVRRRRHAAGA